LLANQVVVPALLEGVHEIQETPEEEFEVEMSKRWFRSVFKKLDETGIKIRNTDASAMEAVQAILKLPLRRSLEGLIQMNPMEEGQ
jgi:transcriptional/translational regulatory protein YebC/TACO1